MVQGDSGAHASGQQEYGTLLNDILLGARLGETPDVAVKDGFDALLLQSAQHGQFIALSQSAAISLETLRRQVISKRHLDDYASTQLLSDILECLTNALLLSNRGELPSDLSAFVEQEVFGPTGVWTVTFPVQNLVLKGASVAIDNVRIQSCTVQQET
jgi:hypothetical protein